MVQYCDRVYAYMQICSKVYCDRVYFLCTERIATGQVFDPQRHPPPPRPHESRVPPPPGASNWQPNPECEKKHSMQV